MTWEADLRHHLGIVRGPAIGIPLTIDHEKSIDEMANMLLDDTTINSDRSIVKHLPRLPPDDAWAQETAGEINKMQLSQSVSPGQRLRSQPRGFRKLLRSQPLQEIGQESTCQSYTFGEGMAPPIPRRSSKRKSLIPHISPPLSDAGTSQAALINAKVKAMIDATTALKGSEAGKVHTGPYVPAKRRRLQENKVIVRMRAVINNQLNARSVKRRHDPVRDDHLLDSSLNELQDEEDFSRFVSANDIRLNEGIAISQVIDRVLLIPSEFRLRLIFLSHAYSYQLHFLNF